MTAAPMTASIVVLHYGNPALTDACLDSIEDGPEVVLVDNGSLGYWHSRADLLIAPRGNLGFARGCNVGARSAEGDLLVFLNNDTVTTPGWLHALERPFDEPEVGVAGAKLLYPDGKVQHAGVDLYRDERGILTGAHADQVFADARRDVPAVTGACMAVRRKWFEQVGGFDTGYWNGYEDVDLCLQATEAGLVVRYEPACVVVHHESRSGAERWSKVRENVERLQQRWPHVCRREVA